MFNEFKNKTSLIKKINLVKLSFKFKLTKQVKAANSKQKETSMKSTKSRFSVCICDDNLNVEVLATFETKEEAKKYKTELRNSDVYIAAGEIFE